MLDLKNWRLTFCRKQIFFKAEGLSALSPIDQEFDILEVQPYWNKLKANSLEVDYIVPVVEFVNGVGSSHFKIGKKPFKNNI